MWKNLLAGLLVGIILVQGSMPLASALSETNYSLLPVLADSPVQQSTNRMQISVRAVGKPAIPFKTQNGRRIEEKSPENLTLPHLVLKRNGFLTPGYERTLHITVSDLAIPPSGAFVVLTIETQHGDPDQGGGEENRIQVWQDAIEVAELGNSPFLKFTVQLDETTLFEGKLNPTPTDYFRTKVVVIDLKGQHVAETVTDYAFLMENQWQVPLPELDEQTPGAAPNRLAVYFCDMFPFAVNPNVPGGRLQRAEVERYIQVELIPEMVEAIRTQTNLWGFPWYAEWANHREGEDLKLLSVALTNSDTWYHGPAPSRGHAEISIRVDGSMMEYETLTDGIMSTFHHELFHNLQRNISLHFGGHTDIDGADDAWEAVSEGTAVLASSVGQPAIQFERSLGWRSYLARAKGFIGEEGANGGGLNQSYETIDYHSAIYWRFLYEQCGGMEGGIEEPVTGMKVIRTMLETLYAAEITDVTRDSSIIEELPRLMDQVFEKEESCPFTNYADSLKQFAHAVYALKSEYGRCLKPGIPAGCGFYDPNGLYPQPPVRTVELVAAPQAISADIPSSYGIDFIEIQVGSVMNGQSMYIKFTNTSGEGAIFSVQVLAVQFLDDYTSQPAYMVPVARYGQSAELIEETGNGTFVFHIDRTELENMDCLGLVITRLDANEKSEDGDYELTFQVQ